MRLSWEYLFGGILFFGLFFFSPLLQAVGPTQTTIIICTALVLIAFIKVTEHLTEHRALFIRRKRTDEDEDEDG